MFGRLTALAGALLTLAACATAPPAPPAPPPRSAPPTTPPVEDPSLPPVTGVTPPSLGPPSLVASPSPTGFPQDPAVGCAGRPGLDQVIALVRAKGIIDGTGQVSAQLGPLCAGTWQYTVLAEPQREPLQVISQGPATALVLVTAGTDVCTDAVRAQAPVGILVAAHCA